MNTALITRDNTGQAITLPPSIVGIDPDAITWKGILKVGTATAIAAGATAVQEIRISRRELQHRISELEKANIVLRAQAELAALKAAAKPKAKRWTAAECDRLVELRASGMKYAAIADALGTGRTAAAVGAKARALAGKAKAPAKAPRKARKG